MGANGTQPEPQAVEKALTVFRCHRCNNCCKGEGVVRVSGERLRQIGDYLRMDAHEVLAKYVKPAETVGKLMERLGVTFESAARLLGLHGHEAYRQSDGFFHLRATDTPDLECIFLQNGGCAINDVKPEQCASFPHRWRNEDSFETCAGLRNALREIGRPTADKCEPTRSPGGTCPS